MSTLLVDELYDGVNFDQAFRINQDANIVHIRPWIYLHGTLVDGDFTCEIRQSGNLLASDTISFTELNAIKTDAFFHGQVRFDFDNLSLRVDEGNSEEEYTARFYMDNHTTDLNNFLGIVRNWETKFYDTYGTGVVSNQAPNDFVEPAGLEFYVLRNR